MVSAVGQLLCVLGVRAPDVISLHVRVSKKTFFTERFALVVKKSPSGRSGHKSGPQDGML